MPSILIPATYSTNFVAFVDGDGGSIVGYDEFAFSIFNGNVGVGDGTIVRAAFKYPVDSIPAGSTPTLIEERWFQEQSFNVSSDSWRKGAFDVDGLLDPAAISMKQDGFEACGLSGREYVTTTSYRTDGSQAVDITSAQSISDLAAAINTQGFFATAIMQVNEVRAGVDRLARISGYLREDMATPQLYVEYELGASNIVGGGFTRSILLGRGRLI